MFVSQQAKRAFLQVRFSCALYGRTFYFWEDNMKKLVVTMIAICVVLFCFGCSAGNNNNKILYEKSMKAVELMIKKTDENYIKSIFGDKWCEMVAPHRENLQTNRYLKPSKILQIELEDKFVPNMIGDNKDFDIIDLSKKYIEKSLAEFVISRICTPSDYGISSRFNIESSFANDEFDRSKTWFLYFDGAYAVSVTFIKGEDSTVTLNLQIIPSMSFYDLSLEDIVEIYINSLGKSCVKIEEIVV